MRETVLIISVRVPLAVDCRAAVYEALAPMNTVESPVYQTRMPAAQLRWSRCGTQQYSRLCAPRPVLPPVPPTSMASGARRLTEKPQ